MTGLDGASGHLGQFLAERRRMIETDQPGTSAAKQLSDVTDKAVSALAGAAFASLTGRWAVLALGAYGSQRLLPFSDIDLLVLTDMRPHALTDQIAALLYPLWDSGLEVGHAVRTRKDHLRACAEDLHALTATLTSRCVAGDAALAAETVTEVTRSAVRRRKAVCRMLGDRACADSPYALEPELKNGGGGQRDLDELLWRALLGDFAADAPSQVELRLAQERITSARWLLQRSAGRKVALLDGETADETGIDRSALATARATAHEMLLVARGALQPAALNPTAWDAGMLRGVLDRGSTALPGLECAARRGALDGLVPGLSSLMTLVRPALSHRLTVGAHSLLTATSIAGLSGSDAIAARALAGAGDRTPLLAAALAHDAGKTVAGPGHALRGEGAARATALALGASTADADAAALLTREHLLLAETASSADIDDEEVVSANCRASRQPEYSRTAVRSHRRRQPRDRTRDVGRVARVARSHARVALRCRTWRRRRRQRARGIGRADSRDCDCACGR